MSISDGLNTAANLYHREAKKCAKARAYLAACVMQGAALEAMLQAMCFLYPEEVKRTTVYKRREKRGFKRKRGRALEFTFAELIRIAAELAWFPGRRFLVWGRRTDLAGWVHSLRDLRNYVHPGKIAPQHDPLKFTKNVFGAVTEIFDVANSWLLDRVEKDLIKAMKSKEKNGSRSAAGPSQKQSRRAASASA